MKKKILCILLAVSMMCSSLVVYAEENPSAPEESLLPSVSPETADEPTISPSEVPSEEPAVTPGISPEPDASITPDTSAVPSTSIAPSTDIIPPTHIDAVYEYDFSSNQAVLIASDVTEDEIVKASEGLPQIDAPSEAHWSNIMKGSMRWNLSENGTGRYGLSIYQEGGTEAVYTTMWNLGASDVGTSFESSLFSEALDKMNTGKYYFTVYAKGNEEYSDSDVCKSDILDYVRPDKKLDTPTDLTWDGSTARWNLSETMPVAYELEYRPEGESSFKKVTSGNYNRGIQNAPLSTSFSRHMNEKGTYRFRVRTLSGNIFEAVDSGWSDWSPELLTESLTDGIAAELKELIEKDAGADSILDCLEKKDTEKLAVSLQTDADTSISFII